MTTIRPYQPADRDAALDLVIDIWTPVFKGMRAGLPAYVYDSFWPDGWQDRQRRDVGALLDEAAGPAWVAVEGGKPVGLCIASAHPEDRMGEIQLIGVARDHQGKGIARLLSETALDWMRNEGLSFAMAETGEDPGHAPARAAYEALGFEKWSVARFVQKL